MPVTLAATINSTTRNLTLSGAIAGIAAGDLYLIEDELVAFYSYKTPRNPRLLDPTQIVVTRGMAGTTAASHNSTTPVQAAVLSYAASDDETKPDPIDAGGGGVSVDNGTDPPATVTTLVAPGAVIAGDSATLPEPTPPIWCVLTQSVAQDFHAQGAGTVKWDTVLDGLDTQTPLLDLPLGLGLTIDLTGVTSGITTTEVGVWAFGLLMVPTAASDATWKAAFAMTTAQLALTFEPYTTDDPVILFGHTGATVIRAGGGVAFDVIAQVSAAATNNPLAVYAQLSIVRLA